MTHLEELGRWFRRQGPIFRLFWRPAGFYAMTIVIVLVFYMLRIIREAGTI